jgi:hypothetical protein
MTPHGKCFITGFPATKHPGTYSGHWYTITVGTLKIDLRFPIGFEATANDTLWAFIHKNWSFVAGLLLNGYWLESSEIISIEGLQKLIDSHTLPRGLKEKSDNLFFHLCSLQSYDGEFIHMPGGYTKADSQGWIKLYFKSFEEFVFHFDSLRKRGLIETSKNTEAGQVASGFRITMEGLEYAITLNTGPLSNNCFVAMSFAKSLKSAYTAGIELAVRETGFNPIRIDHEHIKSHVTINDAILAAIKRSRFTIADFTENKHGVYFEAAYALGLGQNVIYTCKEEDMKNLHIDTRQYQYVVWDTPEDLKQKLINKIEVFIKK